MISPDNLKEWIEEGESEQLKNNSNFDNDDHQQF